MVYPYNNSSNTGVCDILSIGVLKVSSRKGQRGGSERENNIFYVVNKLTSPFLHSSGFNPETLRITCPGRTSL